MLEYTCRSLQTAMSLIFTNFVCFQSIEERKMAGRIMWVKQTARHKAWPAVVTSTPSGTEITASSDCRVKVFWYGKHIASEVSKIIVTIIQAPDEILTGMIFSIDLNALIFRYRVLTWKTLMQHSKQHTKKNQGNCIKKQCVKL